MKPAEFTNTIKHLGLSQVGAAAFLCVNDRTVRRWVSGDMPVPRVVELLLLVMVEKEVKPADIRLE